MKRIRSRKRITENGYEQNYLIYKSTSCEGCPLKQQCNKQEGNNIIEINHQLNRYKERANEMLNSESGLYHRSKRPVDVEPVYANIKHNNGLGSARQKRHR